MENLDLVGVDLAKNTLVTDKFSSYGAAMKDIGNANKQETGHWMNNRAENSHLPFRRQERAMQRFLSTRSLQKFATIHASVYNHFNQERALSGRSNSETANSHYADFGAIEIMPGSGRSNCNRLKTVA